jgi:hypothetical protein
VDGRDDDFSGVPAFTLDPSNAVVLQTLEGDRAFLIGRVAWSPEALHLHLHVEYPDGGGPLVPIPGEALYDGDGIEVFFKSNVVLTGPYDGQQLDPGAIQLIAIPPAQGQSARANGFVSQGVDAGALDSSLFASRLASTHSYDVELKVPWALGSPDGGNVAPPAGAQIGLDLAVDYHSRTAATLQYQLLLAVGLVADAGSDGCPMDPHPSCDDRTWCTPVLAGP